MTNIDFDSCFDTGELEFENLPEELVQENIESTKVGDLLTRISSEDHGWICLVEGNKVEVVDINNCTDEQFIKWLSVYYPVLVKDVEEEPSLLKDKSSLLDYVCDQHQKFKIKQAGL